MKGRCRIFTRAFTTKPLELSKFPGAKAPFTAELEIRKNFRQTPVFRVLNTLGEPVRGDYKLPFPDEKLVSMYRTMVQLSEMDKRFYDAQRQGRISFYMTNFGEEGTHIGSAAALDPTDVVFGQYREAGVLMYRGFTMDQFANQCFSNVFDLGKGRQMPVHYGSRALNFQTISSPLSTQIPQATGAAYAIKLDNKKLLKDQKPGTTISESGGRCVICYFGDGAASEGDFHVALNFGATLDCPVIFFCRNNGYAISTPTSEQYRGDGIVSRGEGYGMACIRVDGNDVLAVYQATLAARELSVNESRPVLIEAMTYRGGHHSTSDDSSRYRSQAEINSWAETDNPVTRCRLYLEKSGLWDADKEVLCRHEMRKNVMDAMLKAERARRPPISHLFTDVFHDVPPHLREQQTELLSHISRYESNYGAVLEEFEKDSDYTDPSKEQGS